jgi:hypothetical protein
LNPMAEDQGRDFPRRLAGRLCLAPGAAHRSARISRPLRPRDAAVPDLD